MSTGLPLLTIFEKKGGGALIWGQCAQSEDYVILIAEICCLKKY